MKITKTELAIIKIFCVENKLDILTGIISTIENKIQNIEDISRVCEIDEIIDLETNFNNLYSHYYSDSKHFVKTIKNKKIDLTEILKLFELIPTIEKEQQKLIAHIFNSSPKHSRTVNDFITDCITIYITYKITESTDDFEKALEAIII